MCCNSLVAQYAKCMPMEPTGAMAWKCMEEVEERLGIDLGPYFNEMLQAEARGKLCFTYLGPEKIRLDENNKPYNCILSLLYGNIYFFTEVEFDSRL